MNTFFNQTAWGVAMVFAGCVCAGQAMAQSPAEIMAQMHKAAIDAGQTKVTIYNPSAASNKPLFDGFLATFPDMQLEAVDLIGPAMIARLDAEFATGAPQAEVVMNSEPDQLGLAKNGYLEAYAPPTAADLPANFVGMDGLWTDYGMTIGGIYYNSSRLTAEEAPKSYADLIDPKWNGRLATGSLRSASGTSQGFTALLRDGVITQEWVKTLAQSGIFITPTVSAAVQAVASGQADVGIDIPIYFFENAKAQGAPIEFVFPEEGVTSVALGVAKFRDSANPLAGELFISWLYTTEAQQILAEMGMQSPMPGAPVSPRVPEGRSIEFHPIDWKTLEEVYPKQLEIYQAEFAS